MFVVTVQGHSHFRKEVKHAQVPIESLLDRDILSAAYWAAYKETLDIQDIYAQYRTHLNALVVSCKGNGQELTFIIERKTQ